MKIVSTKETAPDVILKLIRRERTGQNLEIMNIVKDVIALVREKGDKALLELTQRFDRIDLDSLRVSDAEIETAFRNAEPSLMKALKQAKRNIETFHSRTIRQKEKSVQTQPGVSVWREFRPIESVGLYIPGGKAAYPSTVLMLTIPARLAGCKSIVLCTPAGKDGKCSAVVLAAARLCGIKTIFKIGGAQAIAAMAYGTETIPKVLKIFGPGNAYVTEAKMQVFGDVDIDMPAGPSEVLVIADEKAKTHWVAADLLSQLEHGEDSQAILITFSKSLAEQVVTEMKRQMQFLSRRDIIEKSFAKSVAIVAKSTNEACSLANEYAPEHLEIVTKTPEVLAKKINNAGSIFLGEYTNEPLGDYATGANHTLATSGFAKMFPALSTESFGKMVQVQKVTQLGLKKLKTTVETLATWEGLDAHRNAVSVRFSK